MDAIAVSDAMHIRDPPRAQRRFQIEQRVFRHFQPGNQPKPLPLDHLAADELAAHDVQHAVALDQPKRRRASLMRGRSAIPSGFRPDRPHPPGLVKRFVGTDHHIHILRRAGQQGFKRIRRQQIVAIHKRDPLAPRTRKAEVARRADPLIFLRKDMDARVPFGIAARQCQRIVP